MCAVGRQDMLGYFVAQAKCARLTACLGVARIHINKSTFAVKKVKSKGRSQNTHIWACTKYTFRFLAVKVEQYREKNYPANKNTKQNYKHTSKLLERKRVGKRANVINSPFPLGQSAAGDQRAIGDAFTDLNWGCSFVFCLWRFNLVVAFLLLYLSYWWSTKDWWVCTEPWWFQIYWGNGLILCFFLGEA